jgi:hypothetical protein
MAFTHNGSPSLGPLFESLVIQLYFHLQASLMDHLHTSFCLSLLPFEVTIDKFHIKHCSEDMELQCNFCIIMQRQKDYKVVARFPKIKEKKGGFVNRVV